MRNDLLNWMDSTRIGGQTEIAVLAPIRPGRIPGERRTYEERARRTIASIQERAEQGIPTELSRITTIHFGRMMVIRPEHYLAKSALDPSRLVRDEDGELIDRKEPHNPFNPFIELKAGEDPPQINEHEFRSWLLTLVIFDGDLKVYFRDIAEFLGEFFDRIFVNCEDFPGVGKFEEFWTWIRRYQISSDLFSSAYPDLAVPDIKHLQEFKARFDAFVKTVRSPTGRKVDGIDDMFDAFLRENGQFGMNFPAPGGVYPHQIKRRT